MAASNPSSPASHHSISEVLAFPDEQPTDKTSDEDDRCVQCLLCSVTFDLEGRNDEMLKHTQIEHQLIIADVNLIANLKRYIEYWRKRFTQQPLKDFCSTVQREDDRGKNRTYLLLCDSLEEDRQIREYLQHKRLNSILETQQKERNDATFSRPCLFCSQHFEGNRAELIDHMAFDHHFSIGKPDDLVFTNEFLAIIEGMLNSLKCLFCERTFKDRPTLKEHMRKKSHKRLSPKNRTYDKFYVINYLELGKNWQAVQSEYEKGSMGYNSDAENDDWQDWEEDSVGASVVCLFCDMSSSTLNRIKAHMQDQHKFDFDQIKEGLDIYHQVKLVNFIRRQVYHNTCISCNLQCEDSRCLLDHMMTQGHISQLPDKADWDQPQYFFPTYENDSLLCALDEDDTVSTNNSTPIIAEDLPVKEDCILLTDRTVLQDLKDT